MSEIAIPTKGLVLLVGVSGSGKSTFAARHFLPTEVVSSDVCRGLVSDDPNDQEATKDAFALLDTIAGIRLRRGLLTVIDATNVQRSARASLIRLAKDHDLQVDAVVLDVGESVAAARNAERPDRSFGRSVITRQQRDLDRSLSRLKKEGFRKVHVLSGVDEVDAATVVRERPWTDRRDHTGPFDIIGDVHGCLSELLSLLDKLGWQVDRDEQGRAVGAHHPQGRTAAFVGDLVDRGPDTPGVLRLVMGMVDAGTAICVSGNHEAKLVRALRGSKVTISHGLEESLSQLESETDEFRQAALRFMDRLVSHYVLDEGRLVLVHAGLKEAYHGRASTRVRSFALYGDTTGETDEYGLPVRQPWAKDYRGEAVVAYGHTPCTTAEWVNNTICLDTGAVFGGALTALRFPERELIDVPAEQQWYEPIRPLVPQTTERDPGVLALADITGTQWHETTWAGKVKVPEENAAAALEVLSRWSTDPRWLVHLPPTMAPAPTSQLDGFLEHPEQAFDAFAAAGVSRVVCQEKHMGSRAIAVLTTGPEAAERHFGIDDGSTGVVHTRTGRAFFDDDTVLVDRLRQATAGLFAALDTEWLVLDAELLPWSAKAQDLIADQYASVTAAARTALPATLAVLQQAAGRGLDVAALTDRTERRLANAEALRTVWTSYCSTDDGPGEVRLAPFQVLAGEGELYALRGHDWHLEQLATLSDPVIVATRHRWVDLHDPSSRAEAVRWWSELTASGGEGMVVKPHHPDPSHRKLPAGLKVRGPEYLRMVYGPDYQDSLETLRQRDLGRKRSLAQREYGLGLESLDRFVNGRPLWQVHQMVAAVLALESEPVDPRL